MNDHPNYKRWYPMVRWVLGLASLAYLYLHWGDLFEQDAPVIWSLFSAHPLRYVSILALMVLNYALESEKFRMLLADPPVPARLRSLLVIFSGVTISNFTPAKTGEYLGRSVLLPGQPALKVILATVTGNLLQLFWTYLLGLLSFLGLAFFIGLPEEFAAYRWELVVAVGVVLVGGILIRSLPRLHRPLVERLPETWSSSLGVLRQYRGSIMDRALLLSLFRYAVFTAQYFVLLYGFSEQGLPAYSLLYIPLIYLMQSLVPVPTAVDVGFRVYFAQLFFGTLVESTAISYAVLGIWAINLILPAVIGAFYLLWSMVRKE